MKYSSSKPPLQCFMRQSTWYKSVGPVKVRGILLHSTGANNPYISRYVQPDDNAPNRTELLRLLGINKNHNDWNHTVRQAGVHAFVGKLTSGEVSTVQVGEWNKKAWGCASGPKGSCNNGWIQFEICEDGLNSRAYFIQVYQEAVELTAYLCTIYGLDPNGVVSYNGVRVPVILCHQDSHRLGLGSGHADVLHWFPKHGKSMDDFRADVARAMEGEEEMDQTKFNQMFAAAMRQHNKELQDNDCGAWSQQARQFVIDNDIFAGGTPGEDGQPNYMWESPLTREQFAQVLYRFAQNFGLV